MNVTEIIRELKMTKEEFFPLVATLGFDIGERAIKVDDRIAVRLIQSIKHHRRSAQKQSLFVHEQAAAVAATAAPTERTLEVTDPITTKRFAELLGKPVTDVIAILMKNGIMATINENLDFDTVTIIAGDMGYRTKKIDATIDMTSLQREQKLSTALKSDAADTLVARPPVIVVMGHVDHGKTKLLDAIRQTHVAEQEAGGITQSIGAYQIDYHKRSITFIDTPGHEAFTAMRSRGANIADLAILVVAADDGIKPQTLEAVGILEKAQLPFVVAINKMDKPDADVDKVKKQLSELNLVPEDWGGKTICVPVSAKTGDHIAELLDMILLLADMHPDRMKANPQRSAVGTIIESRIDKDAGPIATVLVQTGTLRIGDVVEVGDVVGKIKAMKSWRGVTFKDAGPATPVQFLGLKNAPVVGDILTIATDLKGLKKKQKKSYQTFGYLKHKIDQEKSSKRKLSIIVKADTLGSLEAVVESLNKMTYQDVEIDIVKRGLGNFTEKDIDQAVAAKAQLIGFNVELTAAAVDYALGTQTTAKSFSIIYKLIESVEEALEKLLPPEIVYNRLGVVRVLAIFRTTPKFVIAGGRVHSGIIRHKAIAKLIRGGKFIGEATVAQLQSNKRDVTEVTTGNECGIRLDTTTGLQIGDEIEVYQTEEKPRSLKRL